jgi:hypothetical protein
MCCRDASKHVRIITATRSPSVLFADKHMVVLPKPVTTQSPLYKHLSFSFILIVKEDFHSFAHVNSGTDHKIARKTRVVLCV